MGNKTVNRPAAVADKRAGYDRLKDLFETPATIPRYSDKTEAKVPATIVRRSRLGKFGKVPNVLVWFPALVGGGFALVGALTLNPELLMMSGILAAGLCYFYKKHNWRSDSNYYPGQTTHSKGRSDAVKDVEDSLCALTKVTPKSVRRVLQDLKDRDNYSRSYNEGYNWAILQLSEALNSRLDWFICSEDGYIPDIKVPEMQNRYPTLEDYTNHINKIKDSILTPSEDD